MSNLQEVSNENFDEIVLKSQKPVIVDFWATWCGPCKQLAPLLESVSVERNDITIVKVDVDANPELAKKYGVRGVPTLLLLNNGKIKASKVGAGSKGALVSWIDTNLEEE